MSLWREEKNLNCFLSFRRRWGAGLIPVSTAQ
nr:MAG TPA: hypothetical protein [Caudoviricetes sp.]DAY07869.1 MAG TPA: hypothetical protein [Caudoviricetes sp.]